jgi:PAS domain S-box-containing protein
MRLTAARTETENLFETLANKSPVGICIIQDGRFCYTNPTFQHNTGYSENELLGRDSLELVIPEDRKRVRENAVKMLKGELTSPHQFKVIHDDGSIHWVVESVASVQYRGRPATLGTFVDITAHKQADEALQAEKNKLQSLIDAMEDTLTIQDTEYNIIYQNEQSRIASGGDHLGEKCYRVYEGRETVCEGCPVEKAFKDGKSHTAERMTTIGGKVTFWENTANPIRDAEGKIVSCLEITRNITEHKKQEQALADEATRRRLLIDQSLDGIVVLDVDARVVEANQRFAEMLGYTPEEVRELHTWDWDKEFPPEKLLEMGRNVDEKGLHLETKHTRKDGSVIDVDISISAAIFGGEKLIFCVCRDITDRKQAEEKVQHLNLVLRAIRNINQLIARGTDCDSLLKGACDNFVENRGYYSAWIALLDESGKLITAAEAGLGKSFLQVMEGLKHGELPHCGCKMLEKPGVLMMKDVSSECEDCPLAKEYADRGAMSIRLEYGGKLYGLMSVSTPPGRATEKEEHDLFEEIAQDIAFALHNMEQKQERKQAEESLSKTQAQLSSAVQMAHLGPWEYDAINDLFIFNDAFYELFHTTAEEVGGYTMSSAEYARRFVYLEDAHLVGEEVRKALQADDPNFSGQLDHRIIYADGGVGYISVRFFIIKDATGGTVRTYGVNQDITERKQAEEALQTEKNKLQSLIDAMEDSLTIQDRDYNIIYQNEISKISSGGDYTGEKCYRVYEGRDTICEGCPVEKAFKDGKSHTAERQQVMPSGELSFWENTANPIRDAGGRVVSCLEIGRNITERKKQEQALADELTRRRLLVDQSLDGIVVLDEDARVVEANPRFAEMLGYTLKEVYKLHTWDWDKNFPPEEILEMGRNVDEKGLHLETKHTRKDGSVIDVDISINGTMFGGEKLIFCVCRDITERKRAEEALKNSEESYRELADSITEVFFAMDEHLRYTYWNKASEILTGVRGEDALGKSLLEVFPDSPGLRKAEKVYRAVLKTQKSKTFVNDFDIAGRHYIFEIGAYPSRGGISVFVRDITERKRAEEALRQSEENYRALFDSAVIGTIVIDAETMKVIIANQAAAEMLGFSSAKEVIGVNPLDSVPPEDRDRVRELLLKEFFKQDLRRTHELRMITKDGREIWISATGTKITHEGKLAGLISFTDITERKKMEEAINLQRAYFQQLFDNSPDAILMTDANSKVIQANRGFEVLFGYSNEEAKGRFLTELIVPEGDVQEASASFQRISGGEVIRKESVRRRKDGSLVDVSVLAYPIRSNDKLVGLYGIYSDITERKRAEEAIKHAAEEWRETFDSITDSISIHDRDFKILRANKAFADIFHKKPSQIIGRYCYELHKGNKPHSGCPHKQTLATKKPATAEFYESNLGKYLHESTSPIFDEKGEIVGTVHITRDITEQKQQNERLMMADRLASIGELAAGTAHELNNPLTSVIGFSQLLMEKDIPDDIREDLDFIYNEAQRAANVTKSLLTFGRKHAPVKQLNQINNIIEDVLKLRTYEHNINDIEVKRRLAPDLPEIEVDYFQMQQVFLNIIINAEYFMAEAHKGGTLTITTKKQNSNVRISIADDGPGISRENLSRIFNPFFTTKEAGKGTGLGLSICHGIVSEHGGQIYSRSQPGKGATIVVELPINSR